MSRFPNFKEILQNKYQEFTNNNQDLPVIVRVKKGYQLFSVSDVLNTINPIAKLLRLLFVNKRITDQEFHDAHRAYCEEGGLSSTDINTDRNNQRKSLLKPRMTVDQFEKILQILGLRITDISFDVFDPTTGRTEEYRLSKIKEMCEELAKRDQKL